MYVTVLNTILLCTQVMSNEVLFERKIDHIRLLHYITRRYAPLFPGKLCPTLTSC